LWVHNDLGFLVKRLGVEAACYRPHTLDSFQVYEPEDEEGFVKRFKVVTHGNHLVTHFQCDLYNMFWNMQKWNPVPWKPKDDLLTNLDALWSRERSTVTSNVMDILSRRLSSHVQNSKNVLNQWDCQQMDLTISLELS
jgi:hypothetical protein